MKFPKKIGVLNETNAENKQLRLKINFLRKERTIFDGIYNKLETEILKKKNELLTQIEKKDDIQGKRSEKEKQFEYMQKQSAKENDFFEQHYASIIENIDQDDPKSVLEQNADIRGSEEKQERQMDSMGDLDDNQRRKKQNARQLERSISKKRNIGSLEELPKNKASDFNDRYDMLSEMNELFNKLHLLTQESDLDLIKAYYKDGENLNEKTYQQIKSNEDEINNLELEIEKVKKDLKSKTKGMDDETFKLHLEHEGLKNEIDRKQRIIDEYDNRERIYQQEYENLKTLTPILMEAMKCPISYVSGVSELSEFNENNVDSFQKAMDRRAAQIALFIKQIDEKNNTGQKESDEQVKKRKDNMQSSIQNMSDISMKLYQEDNLKREELITGKMSSLRDKIQSEIQKKINKPNGHNKIPDQRRDEDEIVEESGISSPTKK